jgi:hypothetical protein
MCMVVCKEAVTDVKSDNFVIYYCFVICKFVDLYIYTLDAEKNECFQLLRFFTACINVNIRKIIHLVG